MQVNYEYNETILTVSGQDLRFSAILPNVEPYLVARNDMMNHIEEFIKHKGSKYCFIMEHGVSQMQKNFNKFKRESISAVYIKCNQLTVDCNLTQNLWHGINILVTELNEYPKVIVSSENGEPIVWDVSGNDGFKLTLKTKNLMDVENGCIGGLAGESGGNIRIEASSGENSVDWEIKSNGGKGSSGQHGIKKKYPEFPGIQTWFNANDPTAVETKFINLAAGSSILEEEVCENGKFFKKSFFYMQGVKCTLVKGLSLSAVVSTIYV